jgi:hypothetical protein
MSFTMVGLYLASVSVAEMVFALLTLLMVGSSM